MWNIPEINDNQWHSYKLIINYPNKVCYFIDKKNTFLYFLLSKIDLYIDERLIIPTSDNFRVIEDVPLGVIAGTNDTIVALGACWHGKINKKKLRMN